MWRGLERVQRRWTLARERRETRSLRVRPLAAGFWMLAAAGAAALAIWLTTAWLLDVADEAPPGTERVKIRVEAVRTGLAAGGGAGAAVGLMLAFRRQRHAELETALEQLDAAERRITELYNAAAEQLGSDKAPVRLTALYTLERLANDNPRHQQTIVNIICSYLRMPYTPPSADSPNPEEQYREHARRNAARYRAARDNRFAPVAPTSHGTDPREEHQVRLTAQRILSAHLRDDAEHHWADIDLDLSGASLTEFNLTGCTVRSADFSRATFAGHAGFARATFTGNARFDRATFAGPGLTRFDEVTFSGNAWFDWAIFVEYVFFTAATFSGPLSVFSEATFSRSVWFNKVTFSGNVRFNRATFTGSTEFDEATFTGDAVFGEARFEADVALESASVTNTAAVREPPPGWRIEPSEEGTGSFVRVSPPASEP